MEEAAPSLLLRAWLFFHNDVAYKWFMVYEMFYAVYVNHTKLLTILNTVIVKSYSYHEWVFIGVE